MANLQWNGDDFRNSQDSSGTTSDLISHSGKLQQGYRHGSLTQGLIAYYPFDGDVQDYALDNHGTDNTSAGYVSGQVGSDAKDFDGSDDYVDLGSPSVLDFTSSDTFTISCWVKLHDFTSDRHHIVSTRSGNNNWLVFVTYTDETLDFVVKGDSNSNRVTWSSPTTDTWHHLVGVHESDSNKVRLYVNGLLIGEDSSSTLSGSLLGGDNWNIGRRQNASYRRWLDGTIDDLRIYDRTLSLLEIKALSNISNTSTVSPGDTLQ